MLLLHKSPPFYRLKSLWWYCFFPNLGRCINCLSVNARSSWQQLAVSMCVKINIDTRLRVLAPAVTNQLASAFLEFVRPAKKIISRREISSGNESIRRETRPLPELEK